MGLDLIQECQRSLNLIQEDVEDGILYMDAGAGEAFHFNGGLPSLLSLGARAICSLEQASPFDAAISWRGGGLEQQDLVETIVILTSKLVTESHNDVIRCLKMHPSVKRCTIWTSVSEAAHSAHPDTSFGLDAFHDYKNSLLRDLAQPLSATDASIDFKTSGPQDLQTSVRKRDASAEEEDSGEKIFHRDVNRKSQKETGQSTLAGGKLGLDQEGKEWDSFNGTPQLEGQKDTDWDAFKPPPWETPEIEVKHFPIMVCAFTKSVFVLPSGGSVAKAPLSGAQDRHAVSLGMPGIDVVSQAGGEEHIPAGATLLAHCLQHIGAQLGLKFEVFSLGPLAHAVGIVMSGLSSPPEGPGHSRRPAGLLLIDRSQDLITPASHGDSLLDRIFSSLPRRTAAVNSAENPVLSSPVVHRPSMDLRIPIDFAEEGGPDSAKQWPCFPFFPVTDFGGAVEDKCESGVGKRSGGDAGDYYGSGQSNSADARAGLLGGSLSTSWDRKGADYLEALLGKRTKDSVWLIRKWLQEALRQEKVNVPGKGRLGAVSLNEVVSLRKLLASKPEMALRNVALIKLAQAAEVALGPQWSSRWEVFAGAEKILMLSAGDSSQSIALQLQDMVQQCKLSQTGVKSPTGLSLRDALTLAVVGYGLAGEDMVSGSQGGPFDWEEEQALKEGVVEVIMQGPSALGSSLGFLKGLEGVLAIQQGADTKEKLAAKSVSAPEKSATFDNEWDAWASDVEEESEEEDTEEVYGEVQLKLELRDRLGEVFGVLHKVANACSRRPLRELPLPFENQNSPGGLHTGLMYKLLSLIFAKVDIPGLNHHPSGMGRFFKGGLGRFGLRQAKQKISDQKVLLVFVIGGLNFVEVREAREAQTAVPGGEATELLLGGTTLITPMDMYDLLVGSCSSV